MKVPYFDFDAAPNEIKNHWRAALLESFHSFDFILGPSVSKFEIEWAKLIGSKYSIGVGNGFDGLVLALRSLELDEGFKVAVPAHTFIASWNAVHYAGGTPVGVDVDDDGLIDLDQLESLENPPDVVMPVHMHGRMVNMNRLCEWACANNIRVIEDASQAHGARSEGTYAGSWGDISVFSLYPSKNLGAFGDAGVISTNRQDIADRVRSLRNYGASDTNKYDHQILGSNSRLDSLQAQILLVNLQYLQAWNTRRREIANRYLNALKQTSQMELPKNGGDEIVWHHFAIRHKKRDQLKKHLKENNVETEIHYPNAAGSEYGKFYDTNETYQQAEYIANHTLSLPMSPWHSNEQIDFTIKVINEFNEL